MIKAGDKIYIAGHSGFIGNSLAIKLSTHALITASHSELDLTDYNKVIEFLEAHTPKYILLAAGMVGGILLNSKYHSDLINENLSIQINVLHAAHA